MQKAIFTGNRYTITCGEHLLNEVQNGQLDFEVTKVIIHPNYHGADKGYDIAVFKVNDQKADTVNREEIKESNRQVYPACLPKTSEEYSAQNGRIWVAGWGLTKQRTLADVSIVILLP